MQMTTFAQSEPRILIEWGIALHSDRNRRNRRMLIEDRVGRQANPMTSRRRFDYWHDVIVDHTLGEAMLDRLV